MGPTRMELSTCNDPDSTAMLESAVLVALSKLRSKNLKKSKRTARSNGVSPKHIVEFLKSNYSWIDGDIESQVMTALLSCIKTGLVCALVSGRYRLIGPNARTMATNCVLRTSHGPKCSCLNMLKSFSKSYSQVCCFLENKDAEVKRRRLCMRKKNLIPAKSTSTKLRKRPVSARPRLIGLRSAKAFHPTARKGGKYPLEICSMPKKSLCATCFPAGDTNGIPSDRFSPRDE